MEQFPLIKNKRLSQVRSALSRCSQTKATRASTLRLIKRSLPKSKRSQVWSLDIIVAAIIFLIGIIVLYFYAINYSSQAKVELDELFYDGKIASDLLLSEEDFGILINSKINQSKLNGFDALSDQDKRGVLGVSHNFYFTFDNLEINGNPTEYVGIINTTQTENLIQVTRLTIYKNKPIKFQLFVWD